MRINPSFHRTLLAWGICFAFAGQASAEGGVKPKGVVELFTSQGCSSCPPADAALKKLIDDNSVVALSYHVDYWNYLGWNDTLGSKENTARQYAYAKMFGKKGVYTPQAVLNGRDHLNGADLDGIKKKIGGMETAGKGLAVSVDAQIRGDEIGISIGPGTGKANVVAVYFSREQTVDLTGGENGGKRVSYWHAVRAIETIGMWDGKAETYVLPASVLSGDKGEGCAILLQRMKTAETPGPIIGATTILSTGAN